MYRIRFTEDASRQYVLLLKHAPTAAAKVEKLLQELQEHPRTGTGRVEQLKYYEEETWSRRITKEHRLVYRIYEDIVEVLIVAM
ncbi:MAG: Txe/YoeB family addiction module toxin, partial [Paludibacteraceae bacterium]|nr:Txe/YoeB family addiction module toxin [Paludibacteraceae bacterium]